MKQDKNHEEDSMAAAQQLGKEVSQQVCELLTLFRTAEAITVGLQHHMALGFKLLQPLSSSLSMLTYVDRPA